MRTLITGLVSIILLTSLNVKAEVDKDEISELLPQGSQSSIVELKYIVETNRQNIKNIKNKIDVSELLDNNINQLRLEYQEQKEISELISKTIQHQSLLLSESQGSLQELEGVIKEYEGMISELNVEISLAKQEIIEFKKNTDIKIIESTKRSENRILDVDAQFREDSLNLWIFSGVILLLSFAFFIALKKRLVVSASTLENKIQETNRSLTEEGLKLDSKLLEVLEKQLRVQKESEATSNDTAAEIDHSLALKVADEVVRMEKNISRFPEGTKGVKPLTKGLERIKNNVKAGGYEIVELLNNTYDAHMNIDVINFVDDESLNEGEKVIIKIIRPQVNFNGKLIQRAQVDVAIG